MTIKSSQEPAETPHMCKINHSDLKADPTRLAAETVEAGIQEDADGKPLFTYRTCMQETAGRRRRAFCQL